MRGALSSLLLLAALTSTHGCKVTKLPDGDDSPPTLTLPATGLSTPVSFSGDLTRAPWAKSARTGAFVNPRSGGPMDGGFGGEARITWDSTFLYVGFEVTDHDPRSPFTAAMVDPHVWSRASGVELMIQPGFHGDNRHYFEIQVGANGDLWDTHFTDYNSPRTGRGKTRRYGHQEWKSGTKSLFTRTKSGYIMEVAVPFSSLAAYTPKGRAVNLPPGSGDRWRLNLYIFREGQRRSAAWSPILGKGNFHRSSRFGTVTFK